MGPLELSDVPDYAPITGVVAETVEAPPPPDAEAAKDLPLIKAQDAEPLDDDDVNDMEGDNRQEKTHEQQPKGGEPQPAQQVQAGTEVETSELQAICDLLGIPETDPAKQREAIVAKREEIAAQREQQAQTQQAERTKRAEETWTKRATEAKNARVIEAMRTAGWPVDVEKWYEAGTWEDPDYAAQAVKTYWDVANSPEMDALFNQEFNKAKGEYEAVQTKFTQLTTDYEHADAKLLTDIRDAGFSPEILEAVARSTHEHTQKVIATTNSALAAAQARLTTMEAQISGHAAAIKAAVADERKRILAELGKPNPASGGTGTPSPTETGAYQSRGIGSGIWDRIPVMK